MIDLNFILTVSGIVIGLLGAYLTIHFYRKQKKEKILSIGHYTCFYVNSEKDKNLKISYRRKSVKKIICHIYRLKNIGDICIFRADIPEKLPIKFTSNEEYSIIGYEISQEMESNIKLIESSSSSFVVDFDYLNPNQYFDIQIFGFSDNENSLPSIQGDIIGGKIVNEGLFTPDDSNDVVNTVRGLKITSIACFLFAFLPNSFKTVFLIIIGCLLLVFIFIFTFIINARFSKIDAYNKNEST